MVSAVYYGARTFSRSQEAFIRRPTFRFWILRLPGVDHTDASNAGPPLAKRLQRLRSSNSLGDNI